MAHEFRKRSEEGNDVMLDFDKARLQSKPLSPSQRKRNFRRLAASIRKLDPQGKYLDAAALKIMTA